MKRFPGHLVIVVGLAAAGHVQAWAQSGEKIVMAGPFSVAIPEEWGETAITREVPLRPVYTAEEWKAFREDEANRLKPAYGNRPRHWAIRLPGALPKGLDFDPEWAGDDPVAPQILIHKADEWGVVYTDGVHPPVADPEPVTQTLRAQLNGWSTEDFPNGTPAFVDAGLGFICLKKPLQFQGGRGVRFVGQWLIEPDLARRGGLHYLFLGLSDDDTCQIIATFPVTLPGLPPGGEKEEHLGRSVARYEELSGGFADYSREVKAWLEEREASLEPRLEALDRMIESLVAKSWP